MPSAAKLVFFLAGVLTAASSLFAQTTCDYSATPRAIQFSVLAGSTDPQPPQLIGILDSKFKQPSFPVNVTLSTGTNAPWPLFVRVDSTPGLLSVSLDSGVVPFLAAGKAVVYILSPNTALTSCALLATVTLVVSNTPPPVITSVVNSASVKPGIPPDTIFTIFGKNFGGPPATGVAENVNCSPGKCASFPRSLGCTSVTLGAGTVGGLALPLLYADAGQVNVVSRGDIQPADVYALVVNCGGLNSAPFTLTVADATPGVFTVSGDGAGPGAILNTDDSLNSANNPATAGSIVQIFGTGAGVWTYESLRDVVDPTQPPYPAPKSPVSVKIGGLPAQVTYAGGSPGLVFGLLQVNAVIPSGLAPGPQPLLLKIGDNDNAAQSVTVAVK